ncbi:sigma-70 family RNA polymerase sigma factor [Chitinophaga sp. 22620]|uniref:sigma-70 family RNA polymerase sigma factor n=1 Tax=Chitinophaga sp. 22620 TaxID=3453952 RepID=UPI003F86E0B7
MNATSSDDDKELFKLIGLGDAGAFNELYDRYWKLLLQLAEKKTGDTGDAKDIVQELFVDLWNRRARLEIRGAARTYMISALYLKIFRYFRVKGFRSIHYRHFEEYLAQTGQNTEPAHTGAYLEENEPGRMADILEATIAGMPRQMKKVFTLKHFRQYSNSEIAAELGISIHTVKNHLKEGVSRLRKAGEASGCYPLLLLCVMN